MGGGTLHFRYLSFLDILPCLTGQSLYQQLERICFFFDLAVCGMGCKQMVCAALSQYTGYLCLCLSRTPLRILGAGLRHDLLSPDPVGPHGNDPFSRCVGIAGIDRLEYPVGYNCCRHPGDFLYISRWHRSSHLDGCGAGHCPQYWCHC